MRIRRFMPAVAPLILLAACGQVVEAPGSGAPGSGDSSPPSDAPPGVDSSPPSDSASDTNLPPDGGSDGAADGDAGDGQVPDGGRCVSGPVEGAPCASTDVACNATDRCCYEFVWSCTAGRWTRIPHGMLCLLCQATPCGPKSCPGNQYCVERQPGIPGGTTSYSCEDYPPSCVADWTCGCVAPTVPSCFRPPGGGCTESPRSHVRVSCMGI